MKILIRLLLLIFTFACNNITDNNKINSKKTYYVDALNGDDRNSGFSAEQAWKSLDKINETTFFPGSKILLRSNMEWDGQIELKGSGTKEKPIILSRFGEGENPAIHGKGQKQHTLLLKNVEQWEIRNLEITNTGKVRKNSRRGIVIKANNFGDCHHIVLDSLEIHHVNGSLVKSDGGGSAILWENSGDSIKTRFIDLQITNCHLHHCSRNGINSKGYTNRNNWHPSLKVVIRNNLLEQIPGDGIVPIGTDGALIEYNVMRDCPDILSHQEAAAGIWPWSADHTIIQFNEVTQHRAKWDGQGFDADYNCHGTIIQFNYSHDNNGGFLLVCNNGESIDQQWNMGTTQCHIRYNISINDGLRPYPTEREGWFSPCMHITGPVQNTQIHHNIIVQFPKSKREMDIAAIRMDTWGGWPVNTTINKNVFITENDPTFVWGKDSLTSFHDNEIFVQQRLSDRTVADHLNFVLNKYSANNNFKMLARFLNNRKTEKNK